MAAKFVIKKTSNGQYKFDLKAGNGEIIASSELYTNKSRCQDGITSVITNAKIATVVDETGE